MIALELGLGEALLPGDADVGFQLLGVAARDPLGQYTSQH
jgi:hypothetical protein